MPFAQSAMYNSIAARCSGYKLGGTSLTTYLYRQGGAGCELYLDLGLRDYNGQ